MSNINGVVKWFNDKKGYGFICADNGKDVFVHCTNINKQFKHNLNEGEEVNFDMVEVDRGLCAFNVKKI